jgi:integrase
MAEKRIHVRVQRFKDRPHLVLQWLDPDTGRRKSKSAETADEKEAEDKRTDLEADLNNGRYREPSRLRWDRFREMFDEEYVAARRKHTRDNFEDTLDQFERLCRPRLLSQVTVRTISAYAAALRALDMPGGKKGMAPGTIKVRLQFLHTALAWAVEQELLAECPKFPVIKVPRKKPQPVPVESFERLLAKASDQQTRTFMLCGWLAGLRLAEVYLLEWEPTDKAPWLDLAGDRIVLPAEFVKADEDQWVPIDPVLREALQALPQQGRLRSTACRTASAGWRRRPASS